MSRSYSAGSLVALPRLNALSTARLLHDLLAAAGGKLPGQLAADREELVAASEALEGALGRQISRVGHAPRAVAAADRVEDNAFGALVDWLRAIARLPAERHPEARDAQAILDGVFPEGLSFLAWKPESEWQAAEIVRGLLAEKGHEDTIRKLGGASFLDEIAFAHAAYGKVLAPRPSVDKAEVQRTSRAAHDAIRTYVLRVSAHVKKGDPATRDLADRLLAPLHEHKGSPQRAKAKGLKPAPTAPAPAAGQPIAPVG